MDQVLSPLLLKKIESMDEDDDIKNIIKELLLCEIDYGNSYPEGKIRQFDIIISRGMPNEDQTSRNQ